MAVVLFAWRDGLFVPYLGVVVSSGVLHPQPASHQAELTDEAPYPFQGLR